MDFEFRNLRNLQKITCLKRGCEIIPPRTSSVIFCWGRKSQRGISSVGRAPAWHAGGQRFESAMLHFL